MATKTTKASVDMSPMGTTKGNKDLPIDRSTADNGGKAQMSNVNAKFVGATKGNKDLPIDRTAGVVEGQAGRYIAGRNRPYGR